MSITLLSMRRVEDITTLKKSRIYSLIAEGQFPAPIKVSPGRSAWLASEIDKWIDTRAKQRKSSEERL